MIAFEASIISCLVLNLPIPTLIDELDKFFDKPNSNNTCDDFGEDEVQAEPLEIAILGIEAIID
tara:strand:+ start:898 stop:1089 length:192 start_codon:yes stop_codon:yes gene_type:complete